MDSSCIQDPSQETTLDSLRDCVAGGLARAGGLERDHPWCSHWAEVPGTHLCVTAASLTLGSWRGQDTLQTTGQVSVYNLEFSVFILWNQPLSEQPEQAFYLSGFVFFFICKMKVGQTQWMIALEVGETVDLTRTESRCCSSFQGSGLKMPQIQSLQGSRTLWCLPRDRTLPYPLL